MPTELETVASSSPNDIGSPVEARFSADDFTNPHSLIGEALDTVSREFPGRVLVRWRTLDGTLNQRWISVMKGLDLETGDLVLLQRPGNWPEWLVTHAIQGSKSSEVSQELRHANTEVKTVKAEVDREKIVLTADKEIVLRCGEASITLTRAGKILIRGAYVLSRSSGMNRIKGGVVHIN